MNQIDLALEYAEERLERVYAEVYAENINNKIQSAAAQASQKNQNYLLKEQYRQKNKDSKDISPAVEVITNDFK